MQAVPLLANDLFAAAPVASATSAKTGPEGGFAIALATATESRHGAVAQPNLQDDGKEAVPPGQQVPAIATGTIPVPGAKGEDLGDLQDLSASVNGSVGAANLLIHFAQWSANETGLAASAAIGKELPTQSAVSQMLSAIAATENAPETSTLQRDATLSVPAQQSVAVKTAAENAAVASEPVAEGLLTALKAEVPAGPTNQGTLPDPKPMETAPQPSSAQTVAVAPVAVESLSAVDMAVQPSSQAASTSFIPAATAPSLSSAMDQPETTVQRVNVAPPDETDRIIVTTQSASDEPTAESGTAGAAAATSDDATGLRQEVNTAYIRSHLPNGVQEQGQGSGSGQEHDHADAQKHSGNSADSAGQALGGQILAQKTTLTGSQMDSPLVFAHHLDSLLSNATGATATTNTDSSMVRLPSGALVPEGAAMDQMITHLSMNKRLDTGTINLKLHPQELGELRMEIKVEQDNIKAHIIAQTPQAQEMIDRHLPRLREALEQQGMNLAQVEVTVAANDNTDGQRFQDSLNQNLMHRSLKNGAAASLFPLNPGGELEESSQTPVKLSVMA